MKLIPFILAIALSLPSLQESKRSGPLYPTGGITAPSIISETDIAWTGTSVQPRSTAGAVSWNAGDFIVVIAATEGPGVTWAAGTVTATGLTFVLQKSNNASGTCSQAVWTASPGSGGSQTFTVNPNSAGQDWGASIWVIRNSGGIGNSVEQHTSTKTVNLTATQAHSAIFYGSFDFAAATATAAVPAATHIRQAVKDGTHYTVYVSDLADQASAGAVAYGVDSGAGSGPFSTVAIEIKGL